MAICFRLRRNICAGSAISTDQSELVLASVADGDDLDLALRRADGDGPLSHARSIAVVGRPFDDEASAAAGEGKVYGAAVLDVYSRYVVGWSIDASLTAGYVRR